MTSDSWARHAALLPSLMQRVPRALADGYALEDSAGIIADDSIDGLRAGVKLWTRTDAAEVFGDLGAGRLQPLTEDERAAWTEASKGLMASAPDGSLYVVYIVERHPTLTTQPLTPRRDGARA